MDEFEGSYSAVADAQLDDLEQGDPAVYDAVLDACELVFALTSEARSRSSAITTEDGIRFVLPVAGAWPVKVFWQEADLGPRVEAVFPYDR